MAPIIVFVIGVITILTIIIQGLQERDWQGMKDHRTKGLGFVREVRKLLEAMNHQVEGPGYATRFFGGKINAVHKDYFDCFDLISFDGKDFIGHQISTIENKAAKVHQIQALKMPGWVWARFSEGRRVGYRLFMIDGDKVEEGEIIWKG